MTDRLYYDDPYLTEFEARVTGTDGQGWITLDRSAFYPTSGGQPYDTGILEYGDRTVRVTDVQVRDGDVWHRTDRTVVPGTRVHGRVDWDRRFDHMQQHAADHMLAGAAWELYGGVTIGLHLGHLDSTIDMDLPGGRTHLTQEEADALEALVNARVQRDDKIRCWFPGPGELPLLPLRKRPTVAEHVRVVAMGDYEMVPCGGTHPDTTGQIGPVRIISSMPARGKMRLCFVSGMRAVRYMQTCGRCAAEACRALSCVPEEISRALEKEREGARERQRDLARRLTAAAAERLRKEARGHLYAGHLDFADRETLLKAASLLTEQDPLAVVLLSCPAESGRALVFARGDDTQTDMTKLLRESGGRGGGKPDMAQGSAGDDDVLRLALQNEAIRLNCK